MASSETKYSNFKIHKGNYKTILENASQIGLNDLIVTNDKNIPIPSESDYGKIVKVDSNGEYILGDPSSAGLISYYWGSFNNSVISGSYMNDIMNSDYIYDDLGNRLYYNGSYEDTVENKTVVVFTGFITTEDYTQIVRLNITPGLDDMYNCEFKKKTIDFSE